MITNNNHDKNVYEMHCMLYTKGVNVGIVGISGSGKPWLITTANLPSDGGLNA